jgi:hypothetical protein
MKITSLTAVILLATAAFLSLKLYKVENQKRVLKEDLIELSKVKYGLFSVDEWKEILSRIISRKIEELNLQGTDRQKMKEEISAFLYKEIDEFEDRFYKEKKKTIRGFFQMSVAWSTGTFGELKKHVPRFTENILDFMNDPKNRKAIRGYILTKLNEYADKTFSKIDYASHDRILARYQAGNRANAMKVLASEIESAEQESRPYKIGLFLLSGLAALYTIVSGALRKPEYLILTVTCFLLLFTGLVLPMIEIDARISNMSFTLLGEEVSFRDQVLYYKSKSILEVVELMVSQQRIDLLFVGLLVFMFSVLFPFSKLVACVLYIYWPKVRSSKFIRFIIFKTGKWSMADVMVIAIFMAYIGFSGIITEQLQQIETLSENLDILATNNSRLLTGFFSFTAFALLSLLTSHKLQYAFQQVDPSSHSE